MPLFGPPDPYKLRDKHDLKGLLKLLTYQKDANVRRQAADALGQLGDKAAVEPLIAALGDEEEVRREAAVALGDLGDPRALEPIRAAFKSGRKSWTAFVENMALGKLGDQSVVGALIESLKKSGGAGEIKVLEKLKNPEAVPGLLKIAGSEGPSARAALAAAKAIDPKLDAGKFDLVCLWTTMKTNVFTLNRHNMPRVEFEQYQRDHTVSLGLRTFVPISLPQTWEHSTSYKGCPGCKILMEAYIQKFLPRHGAMPIGYELDDGYLHTYS